MDAYLDVERRFERWERDRGKVAARRLRGLVGRDPVDSFVWEAEFADRRAAMAALEEIEADGTHAELWAEQVRYIHARRVELLEIVNYGAEGNP
jgi:hypothetical protein